jgi:acyl-coenzyme A synthetase/AMP-(fatty) acid ligase
MDQVSILKKRIIMFYKDGLKQRCTIDEDGYMEIKDRTKDLIKVAVNGYLV